MLEARQRVMLDLNVTAEELAPVANMLPCLSEPTVAELHGGAGYALKAAVPRSEIAKLLPALRERGATGLVVSEVAQLLP